MKLGEFYVRIAPFLLGEMEHATVVRRLWGRRKPPMPDAGRLRIYGRFCQAHRAEALDGIYQACRRVVVAQGGQDAWTQLIEDYFRAHPMHHFELNRNAEHFADFLTASQTPSRPAFLAALADLEWWEWQAMSALDDPSDAEPERGPLRLASTVELRPYDWDFVSWLDQYCDADRPAAPQSQKTVVLFWRDLDLRGRRELASPLEMMIIKAIVESVPLDKKLARRLKVAYKTLTATVEDLRAAGIILGDH